MSNTHFEAIRGGEILPGTALTCSFCGADQSAARPVIVGRGGVAICRECVAKCGEIFDGMPTKDSSPS